MAPIRKKSDRSVQNTLLAKRILYELCHEKICFLHRNIPAKSNQHLCYRKVPKFSDARKHCNLAKIQTKTPNHREFHQKGVNGIANKEDSDQTAPLGAD